MRVISIHGTRTVAQAVIASHLHFCLVCRPDVTMLAAGADIKTLLLRKYYRDWMHLKLTQTTTVQFRQKNHRETCLLSQLEFLNLAYYRSMNIQARRRIHFDQAGRKQSMNRRALRKRTSDKARKRPSMNRQALSRKKSDQARRRPSMNQGTAQHRHCHPSRWNDFSSSTIGRQRQQGFQGVNEKKMAAVDER